MEFVQPFGIEGKPVHLDISKWREMCRRFFAVLTALIVLMGAMRAAVECLRLVFPHRFDEDSYPTSAFNECLKDTSALNLHEKLLCESAESINNVLEKNFVKGVVSDEVDKETFDALGMQLAYIAEKMSTQCRSVCENKECPPDLFTLLEKKGSDLLSFASKRSEKYSNSRNKIAILNETEETVQFLVDVGIHFKPCYVLVAVESSVRLIQRVLVKLEDDGAFDKAPIYDGWGLDGVIIEQFLDDVDKFLNTNEAIFDMTDAVFIFKGMVNHLSEIFEVYP